MTDENVSEQTQELYDLGNEELNTSSALIDNNETTETAIVVDGSHNSHHYDHFYQDPTFWVGVSFTLVVVLLFKPISKIIYSMLGNKIEKIRHDISAAENIEEDAKKLLKEYENKIANMDKEVKEILDRSKKEIDFIKDKNIKALDEELIRKKKENKSFLSNLQEQAKKDINNLISEKIINAIKKTSIEKLDEKNKDKLINTSIESISTINKDKQ